MFVQRVKQAMSEQNISQAELVKLTGISKGSISQYLSGRNLPRQKKIIAVENALNVSPEWLVEGDCRKITARSMTARRVAISVMRNGKTRKRSARTPAKMNPTLAITMLV